MLFNVYVDGLFLKLKSSGLGCFIEDVFVGAFGYADDLALLARRRFGDAGPPVP